MFSLFVLLASSASAQDHTNAVFGDFDADGVTDVAVGLDDGRCGYVDLWLSSVGVAWPQPSRVDQDLPPSSTAARPDRCELGWGELLGLSERGELAVYSYDRDEWDLVGVEHGRATLYLCSPCNIKFPIAAAPECSPCCGGGDCCIGGSCQP